MAEPQDQVKVNGKKRISRSKSTHRARLVVPLVFPQTEGYVLLWIREEIMCSDHIHQRDKIDNFWNFPPYPDKFLHAALSKFSL